MNRSRTLQRTVQANRAGASMGSQLQCSSKPQHHCTYCSAGYRCCGNCHSFRLLRSLPKKREKNRLNLIFHIFNGRCSVLPYGLVCYAFLILFLVFSLSVACGVFVLLISDIWYITHITSVPQAGTFLSRIS